MESPSTVAMTAPSTAPSRCRSHRASSVFPAPLGLTSGSIPLPLPVQGSRKEACGYPMFPFPAGSGAPGPPCILPSPRSAAGPRCCGDSLHGDRAGTAASRGPRQGRPWGVSPSPRGHAAFRGALSPRGSVKMEIPQVASVWRNPEETNWFSPNPSLMLVGFHSTLVIAALHLLKGRLMLCTGLIGN